MCARLPIDSCAGLCAGLCQPEVRAQLADEAFDVHDQADGLEAATVGQLRHHGGVDVDAHRGHRGGQEVARGDAVQHRRQHQYQLGALADLLAHQALRLERVGHHVWQRPVVTDRPGQDVARVGADARVHDAVGQQALLHGGADAARPPHAVDRPQMVLVPTFLRNAFGQRHAKRGAEHGHLDVVGRQSVASEQNVDVTLTNQAGDVVARPRVHQHRATHQDDPAMPRADLAQALGDLVNEQCLGFFARDATAHEREHLRLRPRPLERCHPHNVVGDDVLLAAIHDIVHDARKGVRIDDVPVELHDLREGHLPGSLTTMEAVILDVGGVLLVPHFESVAVAFEPLGVPFDAEAAEWAHYAGIRALDSAGEDEREARAAYMVAYAAAAGVP